MKLRPITNLGYMEMISFEEAQVVLDNLDNVFDNHAFIFKYIELFENEYIDLLTRNKDHNDVFQTVNATIGRDLERFSSSLFIEKSGRKVSFNIKGNETDNQNWRKVE